MKWLYYIFIIALLMPSTIVFAQPLSFSGVASATERTHSLKIDRPAFYTALATAPDHALTVKITTNDGDILSSWTVGQGAKRAKLFTIPLKQGTYRLTVASNVGKSRYALTFAEQKATNSEFEPNNRPHDALRLRWNETISATFDGYSTVADMYRLDLVAPTTVKLTVSAPCTIVLFRDEARYDEQVTLTKAGTAETALRSGTYYISVSGKREQRYQLTATATTVTNRELEGNDTFSTATLLPLQTPYRGTMLRPRDIDFYRFRLSTPQPVTITVGPTYIVTLFSAAQKQLAQWRGTGTTTPLPSATYFVAITSTKETFSTYSLQLTTKEQP